jgi:predicted aldo/keto reductase-like oxidoreductase
MQYRKFGRLDWKVSALGFGAMRLPTIPGDHSQVDEPEATRMLHYAIEHGVNYVDTAWMYHDGSSERFLGRALKNGYREKVRLATKLHFHMVSGPQDFDKILNTQLKRLQTDHIDMYLLHGLFREGWYKLRNLDVLQWAEGTIADGRIGHLGFSFHDSFPVFKEIVDAYDKWAMCQLQYNILDEEVQAGTQGIKYAAEKGLAIVVMEPLRGGRLADPPKKLQDLWDRSGKNPVDIALQWLWNKPEISVVLSGMSTMEQVQQNVEYAASSDIGSLTRNDLELLARVRDIYNELHTVPCTKCQYCMPCPNGVDIPRNFELYNDENQYLGKALYFWMSEAQRASACGGCRECEEKCPQQIRISELMPQVHKTLWNADYLEWAERWRTTGELQPVEEHASRMSSN